TGARGHRWRRNSFLESHPAWALRGSNPPRPTLPSRFSASTHSRRNPRRSQFCSRALFDLIRLYLSSHRSSSRNRSVPRRPIFTLPARYGREGATLVRARRRGDEWLHKIKFDGSRLGCRIDRGTIKFVTRHGHDWTAKLRHLIRDAERVKAKQALLDGEVAV